MRYAIFDKDGNVDTDPEPMIFGTRREAVEMLEAAYDRSEGYSVGIYFGTDISGSEVSDMEETTTTKVITSTGNSLIIKVTDECRLLDLDRGDIVELTIRVKERMGMEQSKR